MSKRIGYLGPEGTFTELAASLYLDNQGDTPYTTKIGTSIDELFDWFNDTICDEIIIPIENSIGGPVIRCMDLLASSNEGVISHEIILKINQCLLAKQKIPLNQISHVLSKDQALTQCWQFIHKEMPQAKPISLDSTATGADWVAHNTHLPQDLAEHTGTLAAVGPKQLADVYSLSVLKENIQDNPLNQTRFIVISHNKTTPTGQDKTSIVFAAKDEPGSLFTILSEFAKAEINLSQISSRPIQEEPGTYYFFIDFNGHYQDDLVQNVIKTIKEKTQFFKVLGSYAKGELSK